MDKNNKSSKNFPGFMKESYVSITPLHIYDQNKGVNFEANVVADMQNEER